MHKVVDKTVVVQKGGRIEIQSDELPEGESVKVAVWVDEQPLEGMSPSLTRLLDAGTGAFKTAEEVDAYIRELRD